MKNIVVALYSPFHSSGKTYIAKTLQKNFNKTKYSSLIYSFANPIKEILFETLGLKEEDKDVVIEEYGRTYRDFCKALGNSEFAKYTNVLSGEKNNIWVKIFEKQLIRKHVNIVFIDDLRFLDELQMLKRLENAGTIDKAITVYINNPQIKKAPDESENRLCNQGFDYYLNNIVGYKDSEIELKLLFNYINQILVNKK